MLIKSLNKVIKKMRISTSFGAKGLSLIFAIILWIFVMDQVNPETTKTLESINVNLLHEESISEKGLEMMGTKEFYVNVKIKGRRNEVLDIKNTDVLITADMSDVTKGNNDIPLDIRLFKDSVVIEELAQDEINIFLDEIVEDIRSISIQYIGNVPNNFSLDKITLSPNQVTLKGPETIVSTVKKIVGIIDLDKIDSDMTKRIKVKAVNENGEEVEGITLDRDYIDVILSVNKVKSVRIEPQLTGKVAEDFKIVKTEVSPSVVAIQSKEENIKELSKIMTSEININNLSETKEFVVDLDIPTGVETPYLSENIIVSVEIEKLQSKDFIFEASEIVFLNVPENQSIEIADTIENFNVKVIDIASNLTNLSKSDIEVYIDGSNLKIGKNKVNVLYKTKTYYDKLSIKPEYINVNVIEIENNTSSEEISTLESTKNEVESEIFG